MEYDQVKELIELFEKTDLHDMEVTLGDATIKLNRSTPVPATVAVPAVPPMMAPAVTEMPMLQNVTPAVAPMPSVEPPVSESVQPQESSQPGKVIKAPIVGTFYQASAPDQPAFVSVGDTVKAGEVVCIIEAMKFMNEVTSDISGTVTEILVQDGDFVEFGQELFRVQ